MPDELAHYVDAGVDTTLYGQVEDADSDGEFVELYLEPGITKAYVDEAV